MQGDAPKRRTRAEEVGTAGFTDVMVSDLSQF